MKIISKFKDYYDHVAYIHGGGDPRVIYNRKEIAKEIRESFRGERYHVPDHHRANSYATYDGALYFCGERYRVQKKYYFMNPLSFQAGPLPKDHDVWMLVIPEENKHADEKLGKFWSNYRAKQLERDTEFQQANKARRIEFHRQVGAPVFITNVNGMLEDRIPVLAEIGFPKIKSPEQAYQELAYFMGNTMHESPDTAPRVEMTDKQKIQAAGFDLRASFRHRR